MCVSFVMRILNNWFVRLLGLVMFGLFGASTSQAAVTWDFSAITDEMSGLGTALLAAIGLIIVAGLVIYGIKRAWGVLAGMFARVVNK